VRPKATVMASPDAVTPRTKLAPFIAEIIARWADIEANVGTILTYILRAEPAPTAAMLYAIRSSLPNIGGTRMNDARNRKWSARTFQVRTSDYGPLLDLPTIGPPAVLSPWHLLTPSPWHYLALPVLPTRVLGDVAEIGAGSKAAPPGGRNQ
jgi:hypothetical protein